jgi:hypothetical protein
MSDLIEIGNNRKWKMYFGDGTTLASWEVESVFHIPYYRHRGIQVIVEETVPDGHNWVTTCGDHHYVWDDRGYGYRWWGANDVGLFDYIMQPGPKVVVFGETVDNNTFREIFNRALEDPDFKQPKGTFARDERHP